MATQYRCGTQGRRQKVRASDRLNGLDYLEVSADQLVLTLYFIHNLPGETNAVPPAPAPALTRNNILIDGGVRIPTVKVVAVSASENRLEVTVDQPGDFSRYRLRLVRSPINPEPPSGFDLQLAEIEFTFKVDCPSDFDCGPDEDCPPEVLPEPEINYLAKDYASFRRLLMDRLSVIMPDWTDDNPADVMTTLVELLAYTGDQLSYFQDAVATEAYLNTAHRRTSVRRHARLLDYRMHDGCNARAFVCFQFDGDGSVLLPEKTMLLTRGISGGNSSTTVDPTQLITVLSTEHAEVFETMHALALLRSHNVIRLYTWDDSDCCLPKGATRATLLNYDLDNDLPLNPPLALKVGDLLAFEEVISPTTGLANDANPVHRQVVRLKTVTPVEDSLADPPIPLLEVTWDEADALTFPLCVSATTAENETLSDVSVACGNVVLADHGVSLAPELIAEVVPATGRYRPRLRRGPLTQQGRVAIEGEGMALFDPEAPAASALRWSMRDARPEITLQQNGSTWEPQHDLLASNRFATEFVAEVENDNLTYLRFGDGVMGKKPIPGTQFTANYRIGNGTAGNVGVEALARIVSTDTRIIRVWNPLAATGGKEPEPLEEVRQFAPQAFRVQERAVTEADYAELAQRHPEVQKAVARLRWTGSWYTAFVTIDRRGGRPVDTDFKQRIRTHLERYRVAGYDIAVNSPVFIPLDLLLFVCVKPGYFRADVKEQLLRVFSNGTLADGRPAFFHPDEFTFGQPIYLSQIYRTAMTVTGVDSVEVQRFQRWGKTPLRELEDGLLQPGPLEVIRLDNDPSFPENGKIEFELSGGL